jgi:2-C-methyl-D-erythritol 4-phosphate cytidylyltransferase
MSDKIAIIVAGGSGTRMGTDIPKQFLLLKGKPVLMHTIQQFFDEDAHTQIIVVLPEYQMPFWKELCVKHHFNIIHAIVKGGETRFHSVKNALDSITQTEGMVAIHDGVRPLVSVDVIKTCFEQLKNHRAVAPVVAPQDSIRKVTNNSSEAVDRSEYRLVQTPQCFDLKTIQQAYLQPYESSFTDDASVVEKTGEPIFLVAGNKENIKITTPFDLKIAEGFI